MQFFMSFNGGQIKQQTCYSFTLLISYMVLIHLKKRSSSFRLHQDFPILMVQMLFPQIQQGPGPDFRKVGKSLNMRGEIEKRHIIFTMLKIFMYYTSPQFLSFKLN